MSQLMEAKFKTNSSTSSLEGKKKPSFSFIKDLKEELKKVSWTTKSELLMCTKIVVWSTLAFGLGIYVFDLLIKNALELIKVSLHFIFG